MVIPATSSPLPQQPTNSFSYITNYFCADDSIALHEEEILSDSELSRQFPDEAEDEEDDLLHLLGHNVIDYTYSATADSDTERDTTRGHSNAGGTAGGSRHTRSRIRHVRVGKSTGLPAVSVVGSYLPEEGGAAAAAAQPPPGDGLNTTTNNMNITTAPSPAKPANSLEVEMNLNFEPLAPIAARTRANVSLTGVPIEDLELGALEEQWLNHGVDDEAEYRRFLQDLHVSFEQGGDGGPGGGMEDGGFLGWGELAEEDSDDEDFLEYMERELMEGMDKDGFPLRASKVIRHNLYFLIVLFINKSVFIVYSMVLCYGLHCRTGSPSRREVLLLDQNTRDPQTGDLQIDPNTWNV